MQSWPLSHWIDYMALLCLLECALATLCKGAVTQSGDIFDKQF